MGRKEVLRLLLRLFVAATPIFFFAFLTQLSWKKDPAEVPFFWLQMLSGSSWPTWESYAPKSPFFFALGVTSQVMLGAGPLFGVLWLVYRALLEGNNTMDLAKLMELHDDALKAEVKSLIRNDPDRTPEHLNKKVEAIFSKSRQQFRDNVKLILGQNKAARVFEQIDSPQ